jgi:hypothetical protein
VLTVKKFQGSNHNGGGSRLHGELGQYFALNCQLAKEAL